MVCMFQCMYVQYTSVSVGYTMRMRGYQIYTTEGTSRAGVYCNPESELHNLLVPECKAFPIGLFGTVQ